MKKAVIIAATAVVLVGGSALGYHAYARYDGDGFRRHHSRMSADDVSAYAAARIAALRAGLRLTPDQEKLWPPVEGVLNDFAKKRVDRHEQRREERAERREDRRDRRDGDRAEQRETPNPVERLRKGADRMTETGADLKRLADATEPLYNSLDEAQKRRFNALARAGMRGQMRHERREWRRYGDADRHMGPRRFDRDDGPRFRERNKWREDAPHGAERL
jgi:hypothetical protein